jgi:hypothetical protein
MTKVLFRVSAMLGFAACAGQPVVHPDVRAPKYPPRPPHCALSLVHAPTPDVLAWDDLGTAAVTCHIDIGLPRCLELFRAEACRMGGDIVYALPEKPYRPHEQAIVYRGRVAHTRLRADAPAAGSSPAAPALPSADRDLEADGHGVHPDADP